MERRVEAGDLGQLRVPALERLDQRQLARQMIGIVYGVTRRSAASSFGVIRSGCVCLMPCTTR